MSLLRLLGPLLVIGCQAAAGIRAGDEVHTFEFQGAEREYRLHVPDLDPPASPLPLVLVFHGGAGSAKKTQRTSGYDRLADREGFLVAYPDALGGHWNDGRKGAKFAAHDAEVDDVAFVLEVLRRIRAAHPVDPDRIYATGASNGGIFCQRLALEHPQTFAAVASVIGSLAAPLAEGFAPPGRVSVLLMNGTRDPIVPYGGGEVTVDLFPRLPDRRNKKSRGAVLGTEETAALWVRSNGLVPRAVVTRLPDVDPKDGTRVVRHLWSSPESDCEVVLYEIVGGGHNIPGTRQYLPVRTIGRTCRDIDGPRTVWGFLRTKRRLDAAGR